MQVALTKMHTRAMFRVLGIMSLRQIFLFASITTMPFVLAVTANAEVTKFLCNGTSAKSTISYILDDSPEVEQSDFTTVLTLLKTKDGKATLESDTTDFTSDDCKLTELTLRCESRTSESSKVIHMSTRLTGRAIVEIYADVSDTHYSLTEQTVTCKRREFQGLF